VHIFLNKNEIPIMELAKPAATQYSFGTITIDTIDDLDDYRLQQIVDSGARLGTIHTTKNNRTYDVRWLEASTNEWVVTRADKRNAFDESLERSLFEKCFAKQFTNKINNYAKTRREKQPFIASVQTTIDELEASKSILRKGYSHVLAFQSFDRTENSGTKTQCKTRLAQAISQYNSKIDQRFDHIETDYGLLISQLTQLKTCAHLPDDFHSQYSDILLSINRLNFEITALYAHHHKLSELYKELMTALIAVKNDSLREALFRRIENFTQTVCSAMSQRDLHTLTPSIMQQEIVAARLSYNPGGVFKARALMGAQVCSTLVEESPQKNAQSLLSILANDASTWDNIESAMITLQDVNSLIKEKNSALAEIDHFFATPHIASDRLARLKVLQNKFLKDTTSSFISNDDLQEARNHMRAIAQSERVSSFLKREVEFEPLCGSNHDAKHQRELKALQRLSKSLLRLDYPGTLASLLDETEQYMTSLTEWRRTHRMETISGDYKVIDDTDVDKISDDRRINDLTVEIEVFLTNEIQSTLFGTDSHYDRVHQHAIYSLKMLLADCIQGTIEDGNITLAEVRAYELMKQLRAWNNSKSVNEYYELAKFEDAPIFINPKLAEANELLKETREDAIHTRGQLVKNMELLEGVSKGSEAVKEASEECKQSTWKLRMKQSFIGQFLLYCYECFECCLPKRQIESTL
jgi:hypothetical protein